MIGAAWRSGRAPQVALTNPWTYYAKIATVCFAVSEAADGGWGAGGLGWKPGDQRCRVTISADFWDVLPLADDLPVQSCQHGACCPLLPQLGAGMELFMIKTGFYEKWVACWLQGDALPAHAQQERGPTSQPSSEICPAQPFLCLLWCSGTSGTAQWCSTHQPESLSACICSPMLRPAAAG